MVGFKLSLYETGLDNQEIRKLGSLGAPVAEAVKATPCCSAVSVAVSECADPALFAGWTHFPGGLSPAPVPQPLQGLSPLLGLQQGFVNLWEKGHKQPLLLGQGPSHNCLTGASGEAWVSFFPQGTSDRRRRNGFQLCQGRLGLAIRKNSFMERVVKHWHMLPREVSG